MINLGGLPGAQWTGATGINNSGQVVGYGFITSSATTAAFLYKDGQMINLGSLPGLASSAAYAINSSGVVVGSANNVSPPATAFIYQNGVMTDLNSLIPSSANFHLTEAQFINDAGQIVAEGVDAQGNYSNYLLTPSNMPAPVPPDLTGQVPEPSTLAFAAIMSAIAGAGGDIGDCGSRAHRVRKAPGSSPSPMRRSARPVTVCFREPIEGTPTAIAWTEAASDRGAGTCHRVVDPGLGHRSPARDRGR